MLQTIRTLATVFLLALTVLAIACTDAEAERPASDVYETREPTSSGTGKVYMGREIASVMSHRRMRRLERPERQEEERPDLVIENLPLKPDHVVADIGAGIGYFSFPVAERVPDGEVLAIDIQQEMLDEINKRKRERGIGNVRTILGQIDDPGLDAHSVDLIFIVDSYHEFSHPLEMGRAMFEALRPGGYLIMVEDRAEASTKYSGNLHKMSEAQARKEIAALGFNWLRTETFLPVQHFLVFQKSWPASAQEIYPGYTWTQIGDGIYLHSRTDPFAGPVDGNSVVIVNDSSVYVVDTHINPAAARAVIAKIKKITADPVTHVNNTHWHDDHINGNDAYRDAHAAGVAYADLAQAVDLSQQEASFGVDDRHHRQAWQSYYLEPGLKSAWVSLSFPIPAAQRQGHQ